GGWPTSARAGSRSGTSRNLEEGEEGGRDRARGEGGGEHAKRSRLDLLPPRHALGAGADDVVEADDREGRHQLRVHPRLLEIETGVHRQAGQAAEEGQEEGRDGD